MLRFLPTVRIRRCYYRLSLVLDIASDWSCQTGIDVDVNSVDDGVHGAGTLHGRSLAIDFDTDGDRAPDLESLYEHMRVQMPAGYDVLHERDHVHVEYDVHRPPLKLQKPGTPRPV